MVRLHQEDLCQALAIDVSRSDAKYEAYGGPSLRQVADVLDRFNGTIGEFDRLVQAMTFNIVIGNADAHGRNLSLLHSDLGQISLAPLYDVVSTIHYPSVSTPDGDRPVSTDLAMRINSLTSLAAVTVDDLVEEAASWPYPALRARDVVRRLLDDAPRALEAAATSSGGDGLPDAIVERIAARVAALAAGRPAGNH